MPRFSTRKRSSGSDCGAGPAAVNLPVIDGGNNPRGKIRQSKNSKRRAIVLAVVHLLIIAHVIHWIISGTTISPVEPSEAMEFSKRGVVNAGLIFFSVALLSTLILGRWFCGWGCHLVALQDLCGWVMRKCGVRPKPFRSRTLIYVPLLLGLYMFIWPAFYRLAIAPWVGRSEHLPNWSVEWHLTTADFWATFPAWAVAIPFLLICGFAAVYFLGQKGFCTYGCPYGGFFAPLDRYAPARIRVTDACEHCGHCTAVCTSNVRVHEEVRDYGMVIDQGCMKCLDCVSVCPNEALYFGFGPKPAQTEQQSGARTRKYDMSLREDIAVAVLFAVIFLAFRGEYARFPLLMAAGVAGVMTFVIWKAWVAVRDPNVRLHGFQLRLRGKIKPAGAMMVGLAFLLMVLVAQTGVVNSMVWAGSRFDERVRVPGAAEYWSGTFVADASEAAKAERTIDWYQRAAAVSLNGFGLANQWRGSLDLRIARMHWLRGEMVSAEAVVRRAIDRSDPRAHPALIAALGMVLAAQPEKQNEAMAWYRHALLEREYRNGTPQRMVEDFLVWAHATGRAVEARHILEQLRANEAISFEQSPG